MNRRYLSIARIERRMWTGNWEDVHFNPGVNVLVGLPNTGKTKWLQTLDYLLGDSGDNPFEGSLEEGLAEKYDAARAELLIGEERLCVERRWREPGNKTKVFVDDCGMTSREFQQLLLGKLGIPMLNFPKGNPMSGQTWPELSFRMLLRHVYRQQRFWGGLADQQPEGEQHACILQFLGLAERLYNEPYGQLVTLKLQAEKLKARREQYGQTLDDLARDLLSVPGSNVSANVTTVSAAQGRLEHEMHALCQRRTDLIAGTRDAVVSAEQRGYAQRLGEQRASALVELEELRKKYRATTERLTDLHQYHMELEDELDRMTRAEDAAAVLSDLKVTHCPACDQPVDRHAVSTPEHCFLCHQPLPDEPLIEELGAVRLQFERDRLTGEFGEANELKGVLQNDVKRLGDAIMVAEERLRTLDNELAPTREAVAPLVQEEVSAIDMALGALNERQRQIGRIATALELGQELTNRIAAIGREIESLQGIVDETIRGTDFDASAAQLEDGMNAYLHAINLLRPGVWRHSPVVVYVSQSSLSIRVGARRWHAALGGTDSLYFLMAYHYGLLSLSDRLGCHYPGLSIIDVPGEFSGEAVEDKENFIVQPFIDLLAQEAYQGCQLIMTGVSFPGLEGANRVPLTEVHLA
ncbi:MAG TPA: hypothetical protein VD973_17705 [Symbiobacteriaceae bacterium]|nr:hypothetical protein [Symbiobacteriaceae bacterium]